MSLREREECVALILRDAMRALSTGEILALVRNDPRYKDLKICANCASGTEVIAAARSLTRSSAATVKFTSGVGFLWSLVGSEGRPGG